MRGKHRCAGHLLERGAEIQSGRYQFAAAFQDLECGVPFVDVPGGRLKPERAQGAHTTDTQHDLLLNAGVDVAAVQLIGDGAVGFLVAGQVAVEQVELDMAGTCLPHLEFHVAARELHGNVQLVSVPVERGAERQVVEVGGRVVCDLVAMFVDGLGEVTLPVEHADGDKGDRKVARRLAVVAGENAEAAGIDRQALVETEFGAEIGDQVPLRIQVVVDVLALQALQVRVVAGEDPVVGLQVGAVLRSLSQALLGNATQEQFRVVSAAVPQGGIQAVVKRTHRVVPAVQQIV